MLVDDPCGNCNFSHSLFDDMIGVVVNDGGWLWGFLKGTGGTSVIHYRASLGVFTDPLWGTARSPFREPQDQNS